MLLYCGSFTDTSKYPACQKEKLKGPQINLYFSLLIWILLNSDCRWYWETTDSSKRQAGFQVHHIPFKTEFQKLFNTKSIFTSLKNQDIWTRNIYSQFGLLKATQAYAEVVRYECPTCSGRWHGDARTQWHTCPPLPSLSQPFYHCLPNQCIKMCTENILIHRVEIWWQDLLICKNKR